MTQETIETTALETVTNNAEMAAWSERKREQFIQTYSQRTHAAIAITLMTAGEFRQKATNNHFISQRHLRRLDDKYTTTDPWESINHSGRSREELREVAKERAKEIAQSLPPIKKAVQLIDADTAAKMTESEKLRKKAQKAADALADLPTKIDMNDHKEMTVGEFLNNVKSLAKQKRKLVEVMDEAGREAHRIDTQVNKKLYAGLPGITEACVAVLAEHYDRARGLRQLLRRVEEQIRFGDSEAAVALLSGFEKDEAAVSAETGNKIKAAMDILKAKAKELKAAEKAKAKALKAATPKKKKKKTSKKGGK